MILDATVYRVERDSLLVREAGTGNEIRVNVQSPHRFSRGDCVRIVHDGRMTLSIPPQVTANSIQLSMRCLPGIPALPPSPTQMRAIIIQRRRNELLVRDLSNNRQMLVRTHHAHHFCPRQRVTVRYNTIRMNNPPEVDAIDITPVC